MSSLVLMCQSKTRTLDNEQLKSQIKNEGKKDT